MGKRIKQVFSNSEQVIHLWANRTQNHARSRNVFFYNNSIYSYGYHYELGRFVKHNGVDVILINTSGYSVTTSKHISSVKLATRHHITFNVDDGKFNDENSVRIAAENELKFITENLAHHFRQRKFYTWSNKWDNSFDKEQVEKFNKKCRVLELNDLIINISPEFIQEYNEHIEYRIKRTQELKDKKSNPEYIKKQQEKLQKKLDREITSWKSGGLLTDGLRKIEPQLLRIKGDEVQTTRGASVPLIDAMKLFYKLKSNMFVNTGEKVGSFKFENINEKGIVKIGCHNIALTEAEKVFNNVTPIAT